jgi:two-component system, OmpR family, manganese sensing sensor histidine kinase
MFNKLTLRLLIANSAVFLFVIVIFASVVYFSVSQNLFNDQVESLTTLTDAVVGSIEFPENDEHSADLDEGIPEMLHSDRKNFQLNGASLQWFDSNGKLVSQKGAIEMELPLSKTADFQQQYNPHVLMLSKPISNKNKLAGYLRCGIDLSELDLHCKQLIASLIGGILLSLLFAAAGIVWLVRQSLAPVERTMAQLTQFTADASHELKGPLMAIKTNATVAIRHDEGMRPKDQEKFDAIIDATDQMIRTTSDLLSLARLEHKGDSLESNVINLSTMIEQIISDLKPLAEKKSIVFNPDLPNNLMVMAREEDIRSLFANLLKNAVQYCNEHGVVSIKATRQGKKILLEVIDNGIGISSEELPKVFDRFWRSDKVRTSSTSGSGLGLSIVREIVNRYDGTITLNSANGQGTTASVTLPSYNPS